MGGGVICLDLECVYECNVGGLSVWVVSVCVCACECVCMGAHVCVRRHVHNIYVCECHALVLQW